MVLSDNLSITALVVSLVALIISIAQAILAFLGTADGYRRCSPAVLREWSKFRGRKFIFSEFRFEVKYVTPQITLVPVSADDEAPASSLESCVLVSQHLKKHPILFKTAHCNSLGSGNTRADSINTSRLLPKIANPAEIEKGDGNCVPIDRQRKKEHLRPPAGFQDEMQASWLLFLEELHHLYFTYAPSSCDACLHTMRAQCPDFDLWGDADHAVATSPKEAAKAQLVDNCRRTNVVIYFRRWSWDFMPPDTIKPLAESTLGDVIVLARRMGMKWRTLNLNDNIMQADGNGYALNATTTKGLGIVFKFSATGSHGRPPKIIPTVAADKLLCGILPGDPLLVGQDFELVRSNRSVAMIHEPGGILDRLALAEIIVMGIRGLHLPQFQNEIIILLMPFMPQEKSANATFVLDGFLQGRRATFAYWEGRYALMQALRHRIDHSVGHKRLADLETVYRGFHDLEEQFSEDFYVMWKEAAITNHVKADDGTVTNDVHGTRKLALITFCRQTFDITTAYFQKFGLNEDYGEDQSGRTLYMLLVGAHMRMMSDVCRPIFNSKFKDDKFPSQEQLTHDYIQDFPWINEKKRGTWICPEEMEYVRGSAMNLDHGILHHDHGIPAFFERRGVKFAEDSQEHKDQCEALWWMLMLRGVAWTMSCLHTEDPSCLVPPIYYGNQTPVWLT